MNISIPFTDFLICLLLKSLCALYNCLLFPHVRSFIVVDLTHAIYILVKDPLYLPAIEEFKILYSV